MASPAILSPPTASLRTANPPVRHPAMHSSPAMDSRSTPSPVTDSNPTDSPRRMGSSPTVSRPSPATPHPRRRRILPGSRLLPPVPPARPRQTNTASRNGHKIRRAGRRLPQQVSLPNLATVSPPTASRTANRTFPPRATPPRATNRPATDSRASPSPGTPSPDTPTGYPQSGYGQAAPAGYPAPAAPAVPAPGYDPAQGYQQPGYQQPGYQQPGYPPAAGAPVPAGYPPPQAAAPAAPVAPAFSPPSTEVHAVLSVDDGSGRTYQLIRGSNVIGRGQDAAFRLPDTSVSRRHVDIYFDGQVAVMHDLGSTNGTTVNGSNVQTWQLADGDVIRIGHSTVVFNFRG